MKLVELRSRVLLLSTFFICAFVTYPAHGANKEIPPHGAAVTLFDGADLSNFDTLLKSKGLNSDPERVFQVQKKEVHISGKEFGYIVTKREFENYYLRAEFKWGEGTYAPRAGQARDSGILYNIQGEQKVWPRSIEFQICEGATGDFWMTDGGALTSKDGNRVEVRQARARRSIASAKGLGRTKLDTAIHLEKSRSLMGNGMSSSL